MNISSAANTTSIYSTSFSIYTSVLLVSTIALNFSHQLSFNEFRFTSYICWLTETNVF